MEVVHLVCVRVRVGADSACSQYFWNTLITTYYIVTLSLVHLVYSLRLDLDPSTRYIIDTCLESLSPHFSSFIPCQSHPI